MPNRDVTKEIAKLIIIDCTDNTTLVAFPLMDIRIKLPTNEGITRYLSAYAGKLLQRQQQKRVMHMLLTIFNPNADYKELLQSNLLYL